MTATPEGRALDYLAAHHVMTLSTQGEEGPWAAAVFYANVGFDLYFLSSPATRHCRNLSVNAVAAATVQEDYADWRAIKGVQLEGTVELLEGEDAIRARDLYAGKFPIAKPDESVPAPIARALAEVRWYRLRARRAWFVDNAAGFGQREQVL